MMTREQIANIGEAYLKDKGFPIKLPAIVTLHDDENNKNSSKYLFDNNLSVVSFQSKYLDDPEHELDPGVYIVFVNTITGEVHMPPHM